MDGQTNGHTNGTKKRPGRIGGKTALTSATTDIVTSIRTRRAATSSDTLGTGGLSQTTFDTLTMTNNTTIEFLHYFWTLFLSGDGSRTAELAKLIETLDKSLDRIHAVGASAEEEKTKKVASWKRQMETANPKSNKRRRLELDLASIGGGREVVEKIVAPTVRALGTASKQYRAALEEQSAAPG